MPKRERKYDVGCTWVGNKFNYRVPDDMVLLRCFMGGDALPLNGRSTGGGRAPRAREHHGLRSRAGVSQHRALAQLDGAIHRRTRKARRSGSKRSSKASRASPGRQRAIAASAFRIAFKQGKEAATRITS